MSDTLPSDLVSRIARWKEGATDPELDQLFGQQAQPTVASPFVSSRPAPRQATASSGAQAPGDMAQQGLVPKAAPRFKLSAFLPNFKETVALLLVVNFALLGGLWYRFETTRQPEIATVGVTSLTRLYATKVANDPNATPEVIRAKTEIFQDTVRKSVEDLSTRKKVIILAREAVLTGEHEDLTPLLEEEVNKIATSQVNTQQKGGLDATLLPGQ